jgi:hypothetical protein
MSPTGRGTRFDHMLRLAAVFALAALAAPAAVHAEWAPPQTIATRRAPATGTELAINARGDALVVWRSREPSRVRTLLLRANGARIAGTLPAAPGASDLAVVLDARAIATAAWTERGRLYAASSSAPGEWTPRQLIARSRAVQPTLAVARDRRVLLAWTVDHPTRAQGRTGIAWRRPGHHFSVVPPLRHPAAALMPGEAPASRSGAAFDARGRAYVWTTCDGVVGITRPGGRAFRLERLAPGTAALSVAVGWSGTGLASWVATRCTSDPAAGTPPGVLQASVLRDGAFAPPVALTGPDGRPLVTSASSAFAPVGAGSLVSAWSGSELLQVTLDGGGRETAVTQVGVQSLPLAADAAGNLLLSAPNAGVTVRRPDGTEEPFVPGSLGAQAASAPDATGFAVVYDPDLTTGADRRVHSPGRRLGVSFWRP